MRRRVLTLHERRGKQHPRQRIAPPQHIQYILKSGGIRRGHDADHARELRQRALAFGVEQAFGVQARFEPLELQEERPDPGGLHRIRVKLILPCVGVDLDAAMCAHAVAIGRDVLQARDAGFPHHALQLTLFIFEREIGMSARGVTLEVADFAFDPNILEARIEGKDIGDMLRHLLNAEALLFIQKCFPYRV